jgi:ABC-type branched-subunit amino acid transport system ATPase component
MSTDPNYTNFEDFLQSMGCDTTEEEARNFLRYLISQGLLDWDTDHTGGNLTEEMMRRLDIDANALANLMTNEVLSGLAIDEENQS